MPDDQQSRKSQTDRSGAAQPASREAARAEALRANLRKRKDQARERAGPAGSPPPVRRGGA